MASIPQLSFGSLTGQAKLEDVTNLLEKLRADLRDQNLTLKERDATLEKLKVHGRDPRNADPIYTSEGLEVLCRTAFESHSPTTSREAFRCLANALLLIEPTRQRFIDLGFGDRILARLDNKEVDDEFLISRVAFLATYKTEFHYDELLEQLRVGEQLAHNMERHAKRYTADENTGAAISKNPMEDMAMIETLKIIFGFSFKYPGAAAAFAPAAPHILAILSARPLVAKDPLDTATSQLINALINFDIDTATYFPEGDTDKYVTQFINLLDLSTKIYDESALNTHVTPLVALLRKLYAVAPESTKALFQKRLLPAEDERDKPLGTSDTFASKLLQLSVSPMAPELRDNVSSLLFEISDKDAEKFVQNVGYGFASGYLFQNDVPVPENLLKSRGEKGDSGPSRPVNPITGQHLDSEPKVEMPAMSDEEKEREAERLFVLFERLRQNGIITAENPVATAQREGRFEELPDDSSE